MEHKTFLERLGPAKLAAKYFKCTVCDISHWKMRGIPARRWPEAEKIAKKLGWRVTAKGLAAHAPAPTPKKIAA